MVREKGTRMTSCLTLIHTTKYQQASMSFELRTFVLLARELRANAQQPRRNFQLYSCSGKRNQSRRGSRAAAVDLASRARRATATDRSRSRRAQRESTSCTNILTTFALLTLTTYSLVAKIRRSTPNMCALSWSASAKRGFKSMCRNALSR